MKIGVTGTRFGCTAEQLYQLTGLIQNLKMIDSELHHGDCIGVDAEAHAIARTLEMDVIIHPPIDEKLRAFCKGDFSLLAKTHFSRNRDIVNISDILIGVPKAMIELPSGGTWYTINYARKQKKRYIVIWPDGMMLQKFGE